jgi:hypothetical protein
MRQKLRGAVRMMAEELRREIEHAMSDRMIEAGRITDLIDNLFAGPPDPDVPKKQLTPAEQEAMYIHTAESLPEEELQITVPLSKLFAPNVRAHELRSDVINMLSRALEENGFDVSSPNNTPLKARFAIDGQDLKITSNNMRIFMQRLPAVLAKAQEFADTYDRGPGRYLPEGPDHNGLVI